MIRHLRRHHWAAWLQVVLLLPALAGTICVRDDAAPAWELRPCACYDVAAGAAATPVLSTVAADDCSPCRDHVLTTVRLDSHAGSRLRPAAVLPGVRVDGFGPARPLCRIVTDPSGTDPPRRTLPTLRC